MSTPLVVSIAGGIVHRADGYWVWWDVSGEEDQSPGEVDHSEHGPHPTLESARGAMRIILATCKAGYADHGGVVVRERITEAGKA